MTEKKRRSVPVSRSFSISFQVSMKVGCSSIFSTRPGNTNNLIRIMLRTAILLTVDLSLRPVHQIQINVIQTKAGKRLLESFPDTVVVGTPAGESGLSHERIRDAEQANHSLVVRNISLRGIPDSRIAFPTSSSLAAIRGVR